jgi:hypothetical protein
MSIDPAATAILRSTPVTLRALFRSIPDSVALAAVDEGWSPRDALAHIIDTEAGVLADRVRRIVEEHRPFIRSIDAPARLVAGGYGARSVASLLDELDTLRREHLLWLPALTDTQLARSGDHDEAGEITASDVVHQWAYHDLMHLKQIASMLQEGFIMRMGNTRKFYDV